MAPTVWPQTLLVVSDVEASSRFYCEVFGFESGHGGREYEQLLHDGELVMQLHDDEPDDNHAALADLKKPVGNGVIVWFEVVDFDATVERARGLNVRVVRELHHNENAKQSEFWFHDPDGYLVAVATPSPYRPRS